MATMTMDFGSPRTVSARPVRTTASARPIRLTRRGRALARALTILSVTALAFVALSAGRTAVVSALTSMPAHPVAAHTVVVKPGDTLWSIAARELPGDTRDAIGRIRTLNAMAPSDALVAGQTLAIPAA